MLKRAAALLLVCAGVGLGLSCTTTSSHYLYATIPASSEIVEYREDPNSGVLTQLADSPIPAGQGVQAIVVHPSKKFLYTANSGSTPTGNISLFTISSAGSLTEVTPRTDVGSVPTLLAMDTAGTYLYVGNSVSNDISVFSINSSTGALTAVAQLSGPTAQIGTTPLNMKLSPSGSSLYVTVQAGVGYIEVFPVSKGVIGRPTVGPFQTGTNPFGLVIDSSGKYLYTANTTDNSLSEFTINSSNGSLTPLQNSPIGQTYISPVALLIDKSGKYLYVANQGSSNLSAYTIGSDGALTVLSTSPFGTGSNPSFISMDPSGNYLFVGNQGSSAAVQSFSLQSSTGTLTSVQSYSVPGTATSIAVTQ